MPLLAVIVPSLCAGQESEVRELADKIAALSGSQTKIDLAMNNISSLGADEAAAIGQQLKSELAKRHFRVASAAPADADVKVTLSEGADGYLLVAEVRREAGEETAIVRLAKPARTAKTNGGVILDRQLVWEQPGVILDFALPPAAAGENPKLIVLETGRLVFCERKQNQWQVDQAVIIPPARPWLRAARGHIDISRGLAQGVAGPAGIDCKGDFANPQTIQCGFVSQDSQPWTAGDPAAPKSLDLGGDAASVSLTCNDRAVLLATGKEDWTHADSIQAYEVEVNHGASAAASGNAVEFAGPVTALWRAETGGAARAVVHDLKTGNYEAYIVTATCGR